MDLIALKTSPHIAKDAGTRSQKIKLILTILKKPEANTTKQLAAVFSGGDHSSKALAAVTARIEAVEAALGVEIADAKQ